MFAAFDNFPALLIWLTLAGGLISFLLKSGKAAKANALFFSILSLGVVLASIFYSGESYNSLNQVSYVWLPGLGSSFALILDGLTRLLCLLTVVVFPLVISIIDADRYAQPNRFFGLLMLTQCGLLGVFMASDALVFYLFWELALIPVYFLASTWGGERRIKATFKFFIYTFVGSLFLLIGILYLHLKTANASFSIVSFYNAKLTASEQIWLFFSFFIAFAIKMPLFPLHTWQPEAYDQSPAPVTMILSAVMVKMGLFGLLRWVLPTFPVAVKEFQSILIIIAVIGMVYASLVAIYQDNIKRLIAYSSIAHIGLMAAGALTVKDSGLHGMTIQMFSHGINILAMWIIVDIVEQRTGITRISALGGIAQKAPVLTVFLVVSAFANIALPLTNAFIGEFMLFNGLYQFKPWVAALAGLGIILSAVYTLNMIKQVFYGELATGVEQFQDIRFREIIVLSILTILILVFGVYPEPIFNMFKETVGFIPTRYVAL